MLVIKVSFFLGLEGAAESVRGSSAWGEPNPLVGGSKLGGPLFIPSFLPVTGFDPRTLGPEVLRSTGAVSPQAQ